jgi:hypothetical protein
MYHKIKYIRTKNNEIVVFSELLQHSEFKYMEPVSAGFISFGVNKQGNPSCSCYGESISLGLKSDEERDTILAKYQFNMEDEY